MSRRRAGGHDLQPPIDAEQARYNTQAVKEMLVDTKKLEKSWLEVKRESGNAENRMVTSSQPRS